MGVRSMTCNRVVAYGKLTSLDKHSLWDDGQLLGDYCEVLIDTVLEKNLLLPRPVGKIKKMGQAQYITIAWPFANVCE